MALIAVAADKGSPGVTTTAVALAAIWPRPVLLAECDPAGGDLVYRLPGQDGQRLDPHRGLLSLAVAARRGPQTHQVWPHVQKLRGGLDVLTGVTSAEQGAGLDGLWGSVGAALAGLPEADVIADCGRLGPGGRFYDLLAHASAVVMVSKATLGDVVRLRERTAAVAATIRDRGGPGTGIGVIVVADHKHFSTAIAEVSRALGTGGPAAVAGGLAWEPKSADLLRGEWGGKLDKSLLIRTARQIAGQLAAQLPAPAGHPAAGPRPPQPAGPPRSAAPRQPVPAPAPVPANAGVPVARPLAAPRPSQPPADRLVASSRNGAPPGAGAPAAVPAAAGYPGNAYPVAGHYPRNPPGPQTGAPAHSGDIPAGPVPSSEPGIAAHSGPGYPGFAPPPNGEIADHSDGDHAATNPRLSVGPAANTGGQPAGNPAGYQGDPYAVTVPPGSAQPLAGYGDPGYADSGWSGTAPPQEELRELPRGRHSGARPGGEAG